MANATETLDRRKLNLPEHPLVESIDVQEYVDSIGDPALRITVVLADRLQKRDYAWSELGPIQDEIFRALRAVGDTRFPYVSFVGASELTGPA